MEATTPDNRRITGAQLIIEGEYLVFSDYSEDHANSIDRDLDIEIAELMALTRRGKTFVESGIYGYARLRDLPRLRALHATLKLLDVPRLAAIDKTLRLLPPDTAPETFAIFDDALVALFTRSGHTLPSLWSITRRLRRLIAEVDASVNFNPQRRKKREESTGPTATFHPVSSDYGERSALTLTADTATMAAIGSFIRATAKEHKLGLADSIIKLLTGSLNPAPAPVLHIFTPGSDGARTPGSSAYLPGFGWTDADATAVLEELLEFFPPTTINLDDVRNQRVGGYSPTAAMAAYVRARDGTCIFPGCHTPADNCQLDHRIPYNEGGETTPENLFTLCQHHHNVKTDRRAFYIPDPATGETLWIFANRTWLISESNGILTGQITPSNPRWRSTPASSHAARARVARFNAKCHTLCDAYEAGGDYDACVSAIRELEQEYGLVFEFCPEPEDLSWIPPEPPYEEYG
ncbi:HNH endonuclease signature motif containing protein [Corynebacterium sanguinis]|uniref:HNH endonuclease n=2 Tax=Corynebacterium sanguinis TaxID=2594913 RepID=A0A6C1TZR5_9CORY|nr:HNH endonuclease signature motif containing protein [Corynebacterium sanguinis]MCT1411775.1 HNH endonuclease [Corynebacterium sanguinis]MCT1425289.1 HNH endonuclease [Corynebacterium sanguinis]MCT1463629.1 HNH endonuclease [Corynebacterium sanguinis]MCT1499993.1 HNH endonuclease [Corynebacterium sanguinis]MCT1597456.1 HNH endonuclease [Corynebacterium sanguinis]